MSVRQVGGLTAEPGSVVKGYLGGVSLGSGMQVRIPAVVVNGRRDGPVLVVVTGVHGPEVAPMAATVAAVRSAASEDLAGCFIAVTVANPLAVQLGEYTTPLDDKNLSGPLYYPGNPAGSPTERMAAAISQALERASVVLDMHSNGVPSIPFAILNRSLARDQKTLDDADRYAGAFGVTPIDWERDQPTNIAGSSMVRGIPAMTVELTANVHIIPEVVEMGKRGILNVMKEMGVLAGRPEPQALPRLKGDFVFYGMLRASGAGFLFIKKTAGEKIRKGEVVAEIIDHFGDVREEIAMPITGYLWAYRVTSSRSHIINEGDEIAFIFRDRRDPL
jgi:predicted deacylase